VLGGVESIVATQARLLREAGYDVRVVTGRGDGELVPELDSRHPDVEAVANRLERGDPAAAEFQALRERLGAALRSVLGDRDLVIAHNVLTMPFNLPLAAALGDLGRPVLAWTHDLAWVNPRYAPYQRPEWPWTILRDPQPGARYVTISHVRQRELTATMRLRRRDVPVVPNGIDAAAFLGLGQATRELARRTDLEDADPLLLVPVRVTRRKRLELAIETAAWLRPLHPGLRLTISGPLGPHSMDNVAYADELRHQRSRLGLDGVVSFLADSAAGEGRHPVDDRTIAELYRMADVVLLPSESEGFGLPVLEAGLARTPLVCADIPVLREVGRGGAWTYPAGGGAEAVAAAVERALASRSARLRRRALRGFSWPVILGRTEQVIRECVG
jgi:glycosyltransferase involved in cell wall biosynthesis